MLVTVAAGGCVLSGLHWRHSVQTLEKAKAEYAGAKARYNAAYPGEKPAHPVTLTQPLYMGKFTVTGVRMIVGWLATAVMAAAAIGMGVTAIL